MYCYWTNSLGYCSTTNLTYKFGFNPEEDGWKSLNDEELAIINGKEYFQFGGTNINYEWQYDINGENHIPAHIASKYIYGVSGINLKLKDYTEYSIIYQTYVPQFGWLKPQYNEGYASNGGPATMSALRVTVVPNSEIQDVYDSWNKVTGTNNME